MTEHTKGLRYGYRPNRTYSRFFVIDTTNDKKVATTDSPHLASLICENMNALGGYNPDAVRDVVEALGKAIERQGFSNVELIDARAALARLGGAS